MLFDDIQMANVSSPYQCGVAMGRCSINVNTPLVSQVFDDIQMATPSSTYQCTYKCCSPGGVKNIVCGLKHLWKLANLLLHEKH